MKTKVFIDFRDRMVSAFKKNLKRGHLLFSGTNATLFGNGPELLMATIGLFDGGQPKSILPMGTVQCKKFEDGEELLGARSPHVTMGNLFLIKNQVRGGIWDYFDLGENIVCVNAGDILALIKSGTYIGATKFHLAIDPGIKIEINVPENNQKYTISNNV